MIRQTCTIANLCAALVAAQGEMRNAPKESRGQVGNAVRFYTDLPTLTDLVRPILSKHGLAYIQLPSSGGDGWACLTTRIVHESGEWVEDDYQMPTGRDGAQGVGSALTYARRYALMAAFGIAADDDDGTAATVPPQPPQRPESGPRLAGGQQIALALKTHGVTTQADRRRAIAQILGRPATSKDIKPDEIATVLAVVNALEPGSPFPYEEET